MSVRLELTVNGQRHLLSIEPNRTLVDVLRNEIGLTGTKQGCGEGKCGSCTVLLDGLPVHSCLLLAPQADGAEITTIEGVGFDEPDPLQVTFAQKGAVQCGFCTPGVILTAKALLDRNPHPTVGEIKKAIAGHLCRCTGYVNIIEAISSHAASNSEK
jgi:carbon-monoxide dehydrogenase small subunit